MLCFFIISYLSNKSIYQPHKPEFSITNKVNLIHPSVIYELHLLIIIWIKIINNQYNEDLTYCKSTDEWHQHS